MMVIISILTSLIITIIINLAESHIKKVRDDKSSDSDLQG
jgi:hypothetical protein